MTFVSKKIVFLTGTRADFGKLKSLISITQQSVNFDVHIFATGMHMNSKYGKTVDEIKKSGFKNIFQFINHDRIENMDRTLAKTIDGFSHYVADLQPDLIIVHGDRAEALAGAIVGSLNNILVGHIEGGEISGTIDELIRHAVSKMSHIHFVANEKAKSRLIQLGEKENTVYVIGSPDLDLMNPAKLPSLQKVQHYYDIPFEKFAIAMYHPVTTEYDDTQTHVKNFIKALSNSDINYIIIYPNNDLGSDEIIKEYKKIANNPKFKIYPSIRFEYFLTLLSAAQFIIGNSSAGIREAPYYNTPTIDIGSRQNNRSEGNFVQHSDNSKEDISEKINEIQQKPITKNNTTVEFGDGDSDELFIEILNTHFFWTTSKQKQFQDLN
jgi:UDP-N-acetylglucosamine 2-epimerase (hydrolysing)